jgi:O-acetylserine/cysteine efflux transporter
MSRRDFLLLSLVCLIWGFNFVVSKWTVAGFGDFSGLPPFFYAGMRMALIGIAMLPFLMPIPRPFGLVAVYALCVGGFHFAFLYLALSLTSPSTIAVILPVYVPITTVLSVIFLKEAIRWKRALGITMAAVGVAIVGFRPDQVDLSIGVLFAVCAATLGAIATILNRHLSGRLQPLQSQAWVGLLSFPPLFVISALFEDGQWAAMGEGGWPLMAALAYTAFIVGVVGHSLFFGIVTRNEASTVVSISLMASLWGVLFGVTLMGDRLTLPMMMGGAFTLAGVLIVALRTRPTSPRPILMEQ